jgi:hypothetical protein
MSVCGIRFVGGSMSTNHKDLKLLYTGGSGGFIVLHYLLLTKQYQISIINSLCTIEEIIARQWAIKNSKRWKLNEIYPSNSLTKLLPSPRLYFFCNPPQTDEFVGENLVVYTDIVSQIKLAQYKNANWFVIDNFKLRARKLLRAWQQHYQFIKDPSWPDCTSWRKVNNLPDYIKNEVLKNEYYSFFIDQESKLKSTRVKNTFDISGINRVNYDNIAVTEETHCIIKSAKYKIKLQDFINSNGQLLLDQLDLGPVTTEQLLLLDRWKKLHNPELLEQIGINP